MKWYFIYLFASVAIGGPYDTQIECLSALSYQGSKEIDPGFYRDARSTGVCFQGIMPAENQH